MKRVISIAALVIVAAFATANKNYQNSGKIVYRLSEDHYYHLTADNARKHAIHVRTDRANAKVLMQLESGCKSAHLHLCPVCEMFNGK